MISGVYNITVEQGSTYKLALYWKNSANNPIDMTGYSAKMQIRASTGASVKLLELSSADTDQIQIYEKQGAINLTIGYQQTANLTPSIAVYDLEVTSPQNVVTKLIKGRCRIEGRSYKMKVDVYPNINKVEVYENPISVPVDASWEKVLFTIEDANDTTFVLPSQPMLDRDGDFVLKVFYNAVLAEFSIDYSIDGNIITWLNRFPLEANELIEIWYAPKSAYGSVPGSGEVTSLNHLNDVSIAGPITGQLLVRNNDGKFQNKSLVAGDNVTITNDNADITIASNPNLPLSHLSANGTLENNNAYVIDTSSAPIIMQLPATSTIGKVISVQRLGGEELTISRNGHNVNALAQDISISDAETVTFRYLDASTGWLKSSSGLTSAGGNGALQTSDGSGSLVDSGWVVSSGHLLPSINEQYDIGSATNLVRDIYISNNSLKFGENALPLKLNNQGNLEFDGAELGTGSGIDGLLLSGTLSDGEVIKYNGTNWVNASVDYAQVNNTPSLSAVATSGDYNDLSNTPSLSNVAISGAYSDLSNTPVLANVAVSGSYNDLADQPSLFSGDYDDLSNKPALFSGSYNDLANLPVLFSGSYSALYNKPTLGTSSSLDVGLNANNVVQLDVNAKLPIIDGSQLINITATDDTKLAKANNLSDLANLTQARTNLNVDVAGTDNSTNVTLANVANNYLSITNQEITSGTVPLSLGGTGATTVEAARTALGVDASGTDNSTNVTLANTNYLTITGQEITGGTVPVASGGTGATTAAVARANLGVDASGTDNSTNVTLANTNYLTITGQEITGGTVPVGSGGTGATDATNARTNLGLGTSATLDHGTSAGNLVRLDPTTNKLPAIDGSLLTNLPSGASALNDLSDVVISSASSGQVVVHDGTNFANAQLNYSQVSNTPVLATVATSGDYNDLSNTPIISNNTSYSVDYATFGTVTTTSTTASTIVIPYSSTNYSAYDVFYNRNTKVLYVGEFAVSQDSLILFGGGIYDASNNLLDEAIGIYEITTNIQPSGTAPFSVVFTRIAELDTASEIPKTTTVFTKNGNYINSLSTITRPSTFTLGTTDLSCNVIRSQHGWFKTVVLTGTTSSYTATTGEYILIDSSWSGSTLTITTPNSQPLGSSIRIFRASQTSGTVKINTDTANDQAFVFDGSTKNSFTLDYLQSVELTLVKNNQSTSLGLVDYEIWQVNYLNNTPLPLDLTTTTTGDLSLNIQNGSLLQFNSTGGQQV